MADAGDAAEPRSRSRSPRASAAEGAGSASAAAADAAPGQDALLEAERAGVEEVMQRFAEEKRSIEEALKADDSRQDDLKSERQRQHRAAKESLEALKRLKTEKMQQSREKESRGISEDPLIAQKKADKEKAKVAEARRAQILNTGGEKRTSLSFSMKKSVI
mmetsp:Transcript_35372/g.101727  ORF Transcript_35372/g.101727 Transcript_35372/m.101727 type:complete len:162 (-) Transcript_35372:167-652(-)